MKEDVLIIFKPNGEPWRTFSNPSHWIVNELGVLYVTAATMNGTPTHTIATTLPFSLEQKA